MTPSAGSPPRRPQDVFAPSRKLDPYWWDAEGVDLPALAEDPAELPRSVDVAIIGGGYTGLSAALTLARAGREVALLDAQAPGLGCSSRNGGLVGPSFHKLGVRGLTARYGERRARDILSESMDSLRFLLDFIESEAMDCELHRTGRFRGADRASHYETMARETEALRSAVGLEADMIPPTEQRAEIGSDFYHGGVVYHRDGHLQPALYARELVRLAREAGARTFGRAPVAGVRREERGGFVLSVGGSTVNAREVLVATNGYTGKALAYFRRRLVPLRSALVATEPFGEDLARDISPRNRGFGGSSRLVLYYRLSPDGRRLVFGGRAFDIADKPLRYARDLYRLMVRIFPQLEGKRITHAWSGTVAYTFDHAPHIGRHEGVYYAMGYCGSGVGRATFYGRKVALKILGDAGGRTTLDDLPFETRPLYTGYPWFLPPLLRWHSLADRLGR